MNALRDTGQLLFELHRLARESSPAGFQAEALALLARLIPFDAVAWPTGILINGDVIPHTLHISGFLETFLETWTRYKHEDHLIRRVMCQPGTTFNVCVREEFANTAILEMHCKPNRMEQILCTSELAPITGLYNVLAIYRRNPEARFSEQERQVMEVVVPHLFEAWKLVRIDSLQKSLTQETSMPWSAAIADHKGVLHVADHRFVEALRGEWPDWNGAHLPEPIVALDGTTHDLFRGNRITIRTRRTDEYTFVNVRPKSIADALSKRELEVAQFFALGESYKEIARKLDISPTTVRTHIATIYHKTRINNKVELAGLLKS